MGSVGYNQGVGLAPSLPKAAVWAHCLFHLLEAACLLASWPLPPTSKPAPLTVLFSLPLCLHWVSWDNSGSFLQFRIFNLVTAAKPQAM